MKIKAFGNSVPRNDTIKQNPYFKIKLTINITSVSPFQFITSMRILSFCKFFGVKCCIFFCDNV